MASATHERRKTGRRPRFGFAWLARLRTRRSSRDRLLVGLRLTQHWASPRDATDIPQADCCRQDTEEPRIRAPRRHVVVPLPALLRTGEPSRFVPPTAGRLPRLARSALSCRTAPRSGRNTERDDLGHTAHGFLLFRPLPSATCAARTSGSGHLTRFEPSVMFPPFGREPRGVDGAACPCRCA